MKPSKKEILVSCLCAFLPAAGYGSAYFFFDFGFRGKLLLMIAGLLLAVVILGFTIWRGEKKNNSP